MRKGPKDEAQATPWWLPSVTGIFLGVLFFVLTFTPSLVPRPPMFQGLLGGLAFFIGYSIGYGGLALWRYLELPEVPRPWWRAANFVLAVACAIAAAFYIPQADAWQDEVRARMNMPPTESVNLLLVILVAAVVAVLLMLLARLLIAGIGVASAIVYRWVPRRIAALLGAVQRALAISKWGNLFMGAAGVLAAWLSNSQALMVDGLFSLIGFIAALLGARVSAQSRRVADRRRPLGYAVDESIYVTMGPRGSG